MAVSIKKKYLSTREAASILGLSQVRVRQLCREGRIGIRVGEQYVLTADEVEEFKNIERKPGRPIGDY